MKQFLFRQVVLCSCWSGNERSEDVLARSQTLDLLCNSCTEGEGDVSVYILVLGHMHSWELLELVQDPLAIVAALLIGLAILVLLASRFLHSPAFMAVSSPVHNGEEGDVPSERQAEDPPWAVVGARGRPVPEARVHPLYKKVSTINGQVNALPPAQVRQRVKELNLSSRYAKFNIILYPFLY